jgi:hypothetical protein
LSLRFDDFNSVGEPYTEKYIWQLVVAIEATPAFFGASASLKIMTSAVLFERHPLERTVRWRTVANTFDVPEPFDLASQVGSEMSVPFGFSTGPSGHRR